MIKIKELNKTQSFNWDNWYADLYIDGKYKGTVNICHCSYAPSAIGPDCNKYEYRIVDCDAETNDLLKTGTLVLARGQLSYTLEDSIKLFKRIVGAILL